MKEFIIPVLLFLAFPAVPALAGDTPSADVAVTSVTITYQDDVTTPGKTVTRELKTFQDDTYWSKPHEADIEVTVENRGDSPVRFVRVKAELYHSLAPGDTPFPPMKGELRTIKDGPVWVWTASLENTMVQELGPGEKKRLVFKRQKIRGEYYATDYRFHALAVRVFASPRDGDANYTDNVNQAIVEYGD